MPFMPVRLLCKLYIIQSIYTCLMLIGGRCGGAGRRGVSTDKEATVENEAVTYY